MLQQTGGEGLDPGHVPDFIALVSEHMAHFICLPCSTQGSLISSVQKLSVFLKVP